MSESAHRFELVYFGKRYLLDDVDDAAQTLAEINEGLKGSARFVTVQRRPKVVRVLVSSGADIRIEITPPAEG